jgi:lysophosphatidylcholine acyltransferase/lyso-PAF acetyltransferase
MGFFYVPTRGRPATPQEAPVVVSNHITFFEPLMLTSIFAPSPVGDVENLGHPLLKPITSLLQLIGVSRKDPNSRATVAHTMKSRPGSHPDWPQILIFPVRVSHPHYNSHTIATLLTWTRGLSCNMHHRRVPPRMAKP